MTARCALCVSSAVARREAGPPPPPPLLMMMAMMMVRRGDQRERGGPRWFSLSDFRVFYAAETEEGLMSQDNKCQSLPLLRGGFDVVTNPWSSKKPKNKYPYGFTTIKTIGYVACLFKMPRKVNIEGINLTLLGELLKSDVQRHLVTHGANCRKNCCFFSPSENQERRFDRLFFTSNA